MARPTLLDTVQDILAAMDSDEVNSIGDTIESDQVARMVKQIYLAMAVEYDFNAHDTLEQLTASGTTARPTHMTLPSGFFDVEWIKYDLRILVGDPPAFTNIPFANPTAFIGILNLRNTDDTTVDSITDLSSVPLHIINNRGPEIWTTFDGETIVFDSYNVALESTLVASKTQIYGKQGVTLSITDGAVLDLPEHLFPLLRSEATSICMDIYKEGVSPKIEQLAQRQRVRGQRVRDNFDATDNAQAKLPN
ncbi:hypothetical protein LCGC14_2483670, partial [marine sediment metagenome]